MGEERFRASLLKATLQAVQRESAGRAVEQLNLRLPVRVRSLLSSPFLQSGGTEQFVSLEDAEDFLLGIDQALGDGSGAVLERVGQALATHSAFSQSGELTRGDVCDCMQRMSGEIVRAFVACPVRFELIRTDTGFNLLLGVPGQPRATRVLRHLAMGAARAAFTFALEATSNRLKIYAHIVGDRAEITARYRASEDLGEITPPPSSRERPRNTNRPSVALEVERILSHAPRQGSAPPRVSGFEAATPVPMAAGAGIIPPAPRMPRLESLTPDGDSHAPGSAGVGNRANEPPVQTLRPGEAQREAWKKTL